MNFTISIISDVVCPWCFVGKRRLESALAELPSDNFTQNLLPFQLDPHINPDPKQELVKLQDYLVSKFGNLDRVTDAQNSLEAVALQEGIKMDFSKVEYAHNTLKAHALIQSAESEEDKQKLNEAFMSAYFEYGKNISSAEVLESIANDLQIGFDPNYNSSLNIEAIKQELSKVHQMGINSVPSFIINGKYLIQGAQPKEQFLQVFDQIRKEIKEEEG
jgi:predicted DsbA family dithiol-disulfide isomerase